MFFSFVFPSACVYVCPAKFTFAGVLIGQSTVIPGVCFFCFDEKLLISQPTSMIIHLLDLVAAPNNKYC